MNAIRICNRRFSWEIIEQINGEVQSHQGLTRNMLAHLVCEWLDWRDGKGRLKAMSCRVALLRLERMGLVRLPSAGNGPVSRRGEYKGVDNVGEVVVEGTVGDLHGLSLELVTGADRESSRLWDGLIDRYHYVGQKPLAGAQMRYLIRSDEGILGAVSFSAAAWRVEARDRWIGWNEENRQRHLEQVVNNSRFLILPRVRVKNLASKVLGMCARRVPSDWEKRYGYKPVLLETFVEQGRFAGTCYRAANWIRTGETKGRGKKDVKHKAQVTIKDVYVYGLVKDVRERLGGQEGLWRAEEIEPKDWVEHEMRRASLGDERLKKRLYKVTRDYYAHPQANIPQACGGRDGAKGAYRFFDHERVRMEKIIESHKGATLSRVRGEPVVLGVQDTTVLNYSGHKADKGLGDIGTKAGKTKGLLVHDTMCFTPEGKALGLVDVQSWARDKRAFGKKAKRKQRPIEEKESYKWLRSYDALAELGRKARGTILVSVADREADIYEFFEHAEQTEDGPEHLVRANYNRKLYKEDRKLWQRLKSEPCAGKLVIEVARERGQKKRFATLEIRFAEVELKRPRGAEGRIKISAVFVHEAHPPRGVKRLSWMLLTTLPVYTFEKAVEKVRWYTVRWQIEVYHKVIKSACRIEARELQTVKRLEASLAIDMVVAWRIMYLMKESRENPDQSCEVEFKESEWKALYCFVNQTTCLPTETPSLRKTVRMLAGLGGFLGRKCDGEPGPHTLARGLQRLTDIIQCFRILGFLIERMCCVQPIYGEG